MGISRSSTDGFDLYLRRRRMNAVQRLLTERLRSHKLLQPFHTMEPLLFPHSSRCGTSTIARVGVMYLHCGHQQPNLGVRYRTQPLGVMQQEGPGRVQEQVWGRRAVEGKRLVGARVKPSVVWIKSLAKRRKCSHFSESFMSSDNEIATPEALTFPFPFQMHPFEE